MADYRDHYDALRAAGADLVVVSVDTPAQSKALRRDLALPFPVLSDSDRRVVQEWDVYNSREHGGIAKPAVFIIDRDRRVRYVHIDSVARRTPAAEIVRLLQAPGTVPQRKVYIPHFTDVVRSIRNMIRH